MVCPACGVFVSEGESICVSCGERVVHPPRAVTYAGFWLRLLAYLIDAVVLTFVSTPLFSILFGDAGIPQLTLAQLFDPTVTQQYVGTFFRVDMVSFVVAGLYFSVMESSPWQATFGKRVFGLRVTGLDGQRLAFSRTTARYFAKLLSFLSLFVGFVMAAFTVKKQALHDVLVGSLVTRATRKV